MEKIKKKLLDLCYKAFDNDEIPVAAVIVKNNKIIGYGINDRNLKSSVMGHAELNAIKMATKKNGDWRLDDCEIYISLAPCLMCTGAILESRIKKVYYFCDRTNNDLSWLKYINIEKIEDNNFQTEYKKILGSFFENKRKK